VDYVVQLFEAATSQLAPSISGILVAHALTFTVMKLLGVTGALFVRGCTKDGEGVNFNTAVRQYRL